MAGSPDAISPLGWHVISEEDLLALLRRAAGGENPELVYIEHDANALRDPVEGDDDV